MSIQRFQPIIWAGVLQSAFEKALVYASTMATNRDYEGLIAQAGDSVRITSISDPTIIDYVKNTTILTPETLTDAQRTLIIDQSKAFVFEVDDIDTRQSAGNIMGEAMQRAAYGLRDVADIYVAGLYSGVALGNVVPSVTIDVSAPADWRVESARAYDDVLIPLKVALDDALVPTEGRYCIVSPDFHGVLLRDTRFTDQSASGTGVPLSNGLVGRAAGFNIMLSHNVLEPSAGVRRITAGVPQAITYAQQINTVEAFRPENAFSDAVKGLNLYGAKLVRDDAISICDVTLS